MSTKTLRKRIALVAVASLAAGLVSVAPANAAAGDANAATVANILQVATKATATGSVVTSGTAETGSNNVNRSLGLLYKDSSTGTAQSATVLSSGALALYTGAASTAVVFVASGGAFSSFTAATTTNLAVSSDSKKAYSDSATATAVAWTPAGAGTYTISLYNGSATLTSPTAGTLVGLLTVTVASSNVSGAYSAADSLCNLDTDSNVAVASDVSGANLRANTEKGFVNFALVDSYGVALAAGATVATATNGAYVSLQAHSGDNSAGTGSTAVSAAVPTNLSVVVSQPTANAPISTTVTITYNGTVVCSKSIVIAGETASLKASSVKTQDLSGTTGAMFKIQNFDAAGNLVLPSLTTRFSADSASLNTTVTAASITATATAVSGSDATALYSTGTYTCGSTAGSANLVIKYQNASGSVVKSPAIPVRCADDPYSYTAKFDKSSYVQGEIATLSVQFLDSKGNKANGNSTGAATATVTAPMLTMVGSLAGAATPDANGVITMTFTVGTTTGITGGSYNALVDYPTLTAAETATIQTVKYAITDGSTSNAAVLKAIVSLIASINKQIALLQKALLKK